MQDPDHLRSHSSRVRDLTHNPMHLMVLLVVPVLWLAQRAELIADTPVWLLVLIFFGAEFFTGLAFIAWGRPDVPGWRFWARVGVFIVSIGTIVYAIGWGPTLAIGFLFGAADVIRIHGSRAAFPAAVWCVVAIGFGEGAIALGWAPTLVEEPLVHGLAVLAAMGCVVTVTLMARIERLKERAEANVRESEERFRALVANASDIIIVVGEDLSPSYVSPAFERVLGFEPEADSQWSPDFIHPDDFPRAIQAIENARHRPGSTTWVEARLRHRAGDWHWFEIQLTNLIDVPSVNGFVANLRDVMERRLFEETLEYQARTDALTQLPNRRHFLEQLDAALERIAAIDGQALAVLFLDVDRFKLVNDSLGHEVGDRLLIDVAQRLRTMLRPSDTVARFGGDEFTVLLEEVDNAESALLVAERITSVLREPIVIGGRELFVTVSIGIAVTSGEDEASDLLREADLAMYLAKEKGRARWELFEEHAAPAVFERLELEADLWRAVDHAELVVHYQPEIALSDGRVVALEALVRWDHPDKGILLPGSFVPFAEESSLIVAIDRLVLREACVRIVEWQALVPGRMGDAERLRVSVNLSPRFVRQLEAVDDVLAVLRETGADPHCLQLEITERIALTEEDRTVETLRQLRNLGVWIAIDDFGTGYSSLGYLKRFPIDTLKLDKSFVDNMDQVEADLAIVQAVITMGHAMGMRVTAEGVERPEQAARLRALGCDAAQGFHFSRALTPDAVAELLVEGLGSIEAQRVIPLPRRRSDTAG